MKTRLPFLIAAVMLLFLAPELRASEVVSSQVRVIHATPGEAGAAYMDPALQPIASYLTRSFGARYSSFRQLDSRALRLTRGQKAGFTLPDGRALGLTYRGVEGGFLLIFMELPHLKTNVKVRDGGLFFQAGQSYQGGILILAIHAKS